MSMHRYQHGGNVWHQNEPSTWIDFSANINPWGPAPAMLAAICRALPYIDRYPEPHASTARACVAAYLQVPVENVLLTNGGIDGLDLLVRHLQPASAVICQPTFVEYERISHLNNISVTNLNCLLQRQSFCLPQAELEALTANSLVFLCNPNNPSGTISDLSEIKSMLQIIKRSQGRLLLDEAFVDFIPGASARHLALNDEHLLIAGSLTKIFAIPGLRLGYIIGTAELIQELGKLQTPWNINLLAQAAAETLPDLTDFIKDSLRDIRAARHELIKGLQQLGLRVVPSETNFLLVDLQPWKLSARDLKDALAISRIQIRDCSNFYGLDSYFARIAVLAPQQNRKLLVNLEAIKCGI